MCRHPRLFENFKILKYVNLKEIFETPKRFNMKHVDLGDHCNFSVNYVNIGSRLEILNFQLQNN